jgi:RimJ/RimL family protein N-acetyltransferase
MPIELMTQRLVLRPVQIDHAAALWEALRDPAIYTWISRAPPAALADMRTRFAGIEAPIVAGRDDQWLNWTVWTRDADAAIGMVEATVPPSNIVSIAYMFAPRIWGHGYASEAVAAALEAMSRAGAKAFEAIIDQRNTPSLALARRLGFSAIESRDATDGVGGLEIVWRRAAG